MISLTTSYRSLHFLQNNETSIRVGKRTLSSYFGRGSKGELINYDHVTKLLKGLEQKGCIQIEDTSRDGTLYTLRLPTEIPIVQAKIAGQLPIVEEDYFTNAAKRLELFERDDWTCYYCGEKVTSSNATLDHYHPQHFGGKHSKENLKTSCLSRNSIKSGKNCTEAAPLILRSIQERRARR